MDPATERMIFVVGNSRSGTTLLGKIIGNHSEIHTFRELQFFEKELAFDEMSCTQIDHNKLIAIGERLMTSIEDGVFSAFVSGRYAEKVSGIIKRDNISDPMTLYAAILGAKTCELGKTISCEQTPRYLFVLNAILEAYPKAQAIHIHRDPRAVLLSQKNRWRRASLANKRQRSLLWTLTSWSNYHPVVTSRFWTTAMRKAQTFSDHPRLTEFSYEKMLDEPEATISKLCRFLGIDFESTMLDVPVEGSSSKSDNSDRRGLDKSRIDDWRKGGLSRAEIDICEKLAGSEMTRLGYNLTGRKAPVILLILTYISLAPKAIAAIILNFHRFSNLFNFLRNRLNY